MKIYIAGKITGDENYKQKFATVQKEFESEGHIVLNPALLPSGMTEGDYMRICLAMIETSDMVHFIPDFVHSAGADVELRYCLYTKKKILHR